MKKISATLIIISLFFGLILGGCSNKTESGKSGKGGKTEIDFWYDLAGDNGDTLKKIIDQFNKQSDSVHVKAVFQGEAGDMKKKIMSVGPTNKAPAVFQSSSVKELSDSGFVKPIQDFVDKDSDFDISQLNKSIVSTYSIDNKLYSMPFNIFVPELVYNKEMFKKAGLDPKNPPKTFNAIKKAAKKLTNKDKGVYGFSIPINTSMIYSLFTVQNQPVFNNHNGHTGDPDKTYINSKAGSKIYNWINDMNNQGSFKNYGRTWSSTQKAFSSGKLAMYLDSSAITRIWVNTLSFKFGTARFPVPDSSEWSGVNKGGGQLWISNKVPDKKQKAAWKFIKYLVSPKVQAGWSASTGYVPVTPSSAKLKKLKSVYKKHPQYKAAFNELKDTKNTPATSGVLLRNPEEIDKSLFNSFEELLKGKGPHKALRDANSKVNKLLEQQQ